MLLKGNVFLICSKKIMKFFFSFSILYFLFTCGIHAQRPERNWATYFGSNGICPSAIKYDINNDVIYVAGTTYDTSGIATPGCFKSHLTIADTTLLQLYHDAFLAKFDTAGNLLWATYYGGQGNELEVNLTIDNSGNVYLSGSTGSDTGIATANGIQTVKPPGANVNVPFLVKFNSAGERLWATYYGNAPSVSGNTPVSHQYIACDASDNVYMSGGTVCMSGVSTQDAFMHDFPDSNNGAMTGYIVKFDSNGTRLWGTYFGPNTSSERIRGLYVSQNEGVYIAGNTTSITELATPGAQQASGGNLFLARFSSGGQRLWCTYAGGDTLTGSCSLSGDIDGNLYWYGATYSATNIATPGTAQQSNAGNNDLFLMKYTASGQKLWGTYYGGSGNDYGGAWGDPGTLSISNNDEHKPAVYVTGYTQSNNNIKTSCTYPAQYKNGFIARFDEAGQLVWGAYYDAGINAITSGKDRDIYFCTFTNIHDLATPGALKENIDSGSYQSGLIARFTDDYICPATNVSIVQHEDTLSIDLGFSAYVWYKNGNAVANNAGNEYLLQAADSGAFYVTVQDSCGCFYTSDTVQINSSAAIDTIRSGIADLNIYPNPAKTVFYINGTATSPRTINYTISNITGRQLRTASFKVNRGVIHQAVDCDNLAPGMYYISLYTGKHIWVEKLIKDAP